MYSSMATRGMHSVGFGSTNKSVQYVISTGLEFQSHGRPAGLAWNRSCGDDRHIRIFFHVSW